MAFTRDWNESSPDGTDDASSGDDEIRNLKVEISDRLKNMLYGLIAGENILAQHFQYLQFYEQSSAPATPAAGYWRLYCKAVGGKAELFCKDEDGDEIQLTTGGKWNGAVLANDSIDSQHYAADSIDPEHLVDDFTFDTFPLSPSAAPDANYELANKKYVDDTPHTGGVVQVVNTQTGAVATGTTTIPYDDTIPQNTEGDEYMTLAITPKSITNKLKIDVVVHLSNSGTAHNCAALFQDSTAAALACAFTHQSTNEPRVIKFTHYMDAGTTAETTFKIRIGAEGGTTTFNGMSAARKFGGVMASSITITEIKV